MPRKDESDPEAKVSTTHLQKVGFALGLGLMGGSLVYLIYKLKGGK